MPSASQEHCKDQMQSWIEKASKKVKVLGSQGILGSQEWHLPTCPDLGIFAFPHLTEPSKDVGVNSRARDGAQLEPMSVS